MAQAYQEARLDQDAQSQVGAVGVMQVMPSTAADPVVDIPDISDLDDNVHAGVRYLRWLRDTFFEETEISPLDQTLLAFAAYNAGLDGVQRARRRAAEMGLDPDMWFENVEIAIQGAVSRESAIYVRNILNTMSPTACWPIWRPRRRRYAGSWRLRLTKRGNSADKARPDPLRARCPDVCRA